MIDAPPRGRVLHVVRRLGEPSQTFVLDAILELQRRGWGTDVLSLIPPTGAGEKLSVFQPPRPSLVRRARQRLLPQAPSALVSRAWAAAIRARRPELLHIHFGWNACEVDDIASLGVPALVSFHGSDINAWPHRDPGNLAAYRRLFGRLRWATVVSNVLARRLRDLGYQGNIDVIPAGVKLDRFRYRDPATNGHDPRLLFVGRVVSCKGLDTLVSALPQVLEGSNRVRLEVIGDGELRGETEKLARDLGVDGHVEFRGVQGPEAVAQAMHAADVLVVPSRRTEAGEEEGSPVAPKEALATGVPVVATNIGGIPDIVPPEYRSELVSPDDPTALAAQILHLLNGHGSWRERARIGRAWIEREFDADKLIARLEDVYRTARNGSATRSDGERG
jgi:colanic acid/amylovoran biosynthesis glycosyltransferase